MDLRDEPRSAQHANQHRRRVNAVPAYLAAQHAIEALSCIDGPDDQYVTTIIWVERRVIKTNDMGERFAHCEQRARYALCSVTMSSPIRRRRGGSLLRGSARRAASRLLHRFRAKIGKLRSILGDPFHCSLFRGEPTPLRFIDLFLVALDRAHLFNHPCPKGIFWVQEFDTKLGPILTRIAPCDAGSGLECRLHERNSYFHDTAPLELAARLEREPADAHVIAAGVGELCSNMDFDGNVHRMPDELPHGCTTRQDRDSLWSWLPQRLA